MLYRKILVASTLVLSACGGSSDVGTTPNPPAAPGTPSPPSAGSGNATVEASDSYNTFTPEEVTVAVGKAVRWTFGSRTHNVTFAVVQGAPANVPNTANGEASRTFNTAGTFPYQCTLHAGMNGTVKVQ